MDQYSYCFHSYAVRGFRGLLKLQSAQLAESTRPLPWYHPDYPDAGWKSGQAPLGFGNTGDHTTTARVRTLYLRKSFTLVEKVSALGLFLKEHDGLIAYLNGVEIAMVR